MEQGYGFDQLLGEDETPPLIVNGTVLPAALAALLRYAIALVGTYLVSAGAVDEGSLEGITTILITLATVAYGVYRTRKTKAQLVVTAAAAPNSVAQVR